MTTITFKVSDDEARDLRRKAREAHLTVSAYLRRAIRGGGRKPAAVRSRKCRYTGAVIFAGLDDDLPLSAGTVRDVLEDFP